MPAGEAALLYIGKKRVAEGIGALASLWATPQKCALETESAKLGTVMLASEQPRLRWDQGPMAGGPNFRIIRSQGKGAGKSGGSGFP